MTLEEITAERDLLARTVERQGRRIAVLECQLELPHPEGIEIYTDRIKLAMNPSGLSKELARIRPVYEAAKAWRNGRMPVDVEACEILQDAVDAAEREKPDDEGRFIDVVFDGPPSHESGRFVEVENERGEGVSVGEWIDRGDGMWALRIRRF